MLVDLAAENVDVNKPKHQSAADSKELNNGQLDHMAKPAHLEKSIGIKINQESQLEPQVATKIGNSKHFAHTTNSSNDRDQLKSNVIDQILVR